MLSDGGRGRGRRTDVERTMDVGLARVIWLELIVFVVYQWLSCNSVNNREYFVYFIYRALLFEFLVKVGRLPPSPR